MACDVQGQSSKVYQHISFFHRWRQLVSGPSCCLDPVRKRRCREKHHHYRVSSGSEACWQEGGFETRPECIVWVWILLTDTLLPSGWHPGCGPVWSQYSPHAECGTSWCSSVWLRMGACLYRCRQKPRPHVHRLLAGWPRWSSGVERAQENRYCAHLIIMLLKTFLLYHFTPKLLFNPVWMSCSSNRPVCVGCSVGRAGCAAGRHTTRDIWWAPCSPGKP